MAIRIFNLSDYKTRTCRSEGQVDIMRHFSWILCVYYVFPDRFVVSALDTSSQCFYSNGQSAISDRPCNIEGDVSFCCGEGWSCLSNGLCQAPNDGEYAQGSCTDANFPELACLELCPISTYPLRHPEQ